MTLLAHESMRAVHPLRWLVLTLSVVATCAACSTEPDTEFLLSFDVRREPYGFAENLPPISAKAGEAVIQIDGGYVVSCSGPAPAAKLKRMRDGVTLVLYMPPFQGACGSMPRPWIYDAVISEVPPGVYTLRVEHYRDTSRSGGVVFEERIGVR